MAQRLVQTQSLQQVQQQRLSQQQMLEVKLLEMPLAELEQNIAAELDDNPALERLQDSEDFDPSVTATTDTGVEDNPYEESTSLHEVDNELANMNDDDAVPSADSRLVQADTNAAEEEEMVWGDTISFYDRLKEQLAEQQLTEQDHTIMEYLIGSLDTDGLLRKPLDTICDELAIYQGVDVPEEHIEQVLLRLQTFDPAGIGARSLQECLLLQVERKPKNNITRLMDKVLRHHFDAFTKMHWGKLMETLHLDSETMETLQQEIRRLNPKPGAALGETEGKNLQQVTPDFIIETDEQGRISFSLNRGQVPELRVSSSFQELMDTYRLHKQSMTRQDKEALLYAKQKVERAQGYIDAIKQRRHTLTVTMQAIIDWQKAFFREGDEADLRPMILRDIAEKTGLDISTISRVSNVKYAQTPWGVFPLRFFFSDGYVTEQGEETSTRRIKIALRELVEQEDKQHPLSDETLAAEMKKRGYPIARRTIAKYREQLGLPMARLRRQ